jgi:hypothetical protein
MEGESSWFLVLPRDKLACFLRRPYKSSRHIEGRVEALSGEFNSQAVANKLWVIVECA